MSASVPHERMPSHKPPKAPHPRDSDCPSGPCEGGVLTPGTQGHSPYSPDADFEARGQVLGHKLTVTALVVVHDVLPGEACFWVEGDMAHEETSPLVPWCPLSGNPWAPLGTPSVLSQWLCWPWPAGVRWEGCRHHCEWTAGGPERACAHPVTAEHHSARKGACTMEEPREHPMN